MLTNELKGLLDKIDWKKDIEPYEEPVPGFKKAMEDLSQEEFIEATVYMSQAANKALGRKSTTIPEEFVSNQAFQVNRREIVKEKEYAVFPVVLMVEGVHHPVNGDPVYYPLGTLEESVPHWEGRPIPVFHPNIEGEYVRANSPHIEEDWVIGRIYKVKTEGQKLKGEAWIDVKKAEAVSPGLIAQMESDNSEMEVSTGVFTKGDGMKGIWNEEEYEETVLQMVPDHLALLPGSVGACSWDDGCGVRANSGEKEEEQKIRMNKFKDEKKSGIVSNTPEEVDNDDDPNQTNKGADQMNKDDKTKSCCPEKVEALIANEATAWVEDDREFLSGLNEAQMEKLYLSVQEKKEEPKPEPKKEEPKPEPKNNASPPQPAPKPLTTEEYIHTAPPEIRAVLNAGMSQLKAKRAEYIATITANARNRFTAQHLEMMDLGALEALAELAAPLEDYSGVSGAGSFVNNQEAPLPPAPALFEVKQ